MPAKSNFAYLLDRKGEQQPLISDVQQWLPGYYLFSVCCME
jgi:hypothetical protein